MVFRNKVKSLVMNFVVINFKRKHLLWKQFKRLNQVQNQKLMKEMMTEGGELTQKQGRNIQT